MRTPYFELTNENWDNENLSKQEKSAYVGLLLKVWSNSVKEQCFAYSK